TDKYLIREQNEALVLQTFIENKGLSRAQFAKETGLNKASVSSITNSLIDSGLVEETGIGQYGKTGGRKTIFVNFCGKDGL
ncbi:MarR family transcriptional regulator, partial [Streptococcus suis]